MAEKIRIASENYVDEKLRDIDVDVTGTVEITDGTPEKEGTVLTVNPEAEEISVYSAEEVDALVAVERARIDQFVALEEGSTTGDAELIDARIDKDGVTHANVGDHIRSITSQLSGQISNLDGLTYGIYVGDTQPTNGVMYWLDTSVEVDVEPDEPEVTLSSITATYTGGDVAVGTSLPSLTGITVTAHYSDGSTANVTGYTLSGTIEEGSNTVTISYGGKSTTITVIGYVENEPEVTLTSISASYTGGEVTIGTALTALTGITVTGHYSDGSTSEITGYTLSGEIVEGTNTITVTYQGKTATFTVTGVAESGGDSGDSLTVEQVKELIITQYSKDGSRPKVENNKIVDMLTNGFITLSVANSDYAKPTIRLDGDNGNLWVTQSVTDVLKSTSSTILAYTQFEDGNYYVAREYTIELLDGTTPEEKASLYNGLWLVLAHCSDFWVLKANDYDINDIVELIQEASV